MRACPRCAAWPAPVAHPLRCQPVSQSHRRGGAAEGHTTPVAVCPRPRTSVPGTKPGTHHSNMPRPSIASSQPSLFQNLLSFSSVSVGHHLILVSLVYKAATGQRHASRSDTARQPAQRWERAPHDTPPACQVQVATLQRTHMHKAGSCANNEFNNRGAPHCRCPRMVVHQHPPPTLGAPGCSLADAGPLPPPPAAAVKSSARGVLYPSLPTDNNGGHARPALDVPAVGQQPVASDHQRGAAFLKTAPHRAREAGDNDITASPSLTRLPLYT